MSRKNHKLIDGKLLQTDKRYSQLKMKQQEKISGWYYQAYRRVYFESGKLPDARQEDDIPFDLMQKIENAEIWIPAYEVERHFASKRASIQKRILKQSGI